MKFKNDSIHNSIKSKRYLENRDKFDHKVKYLYTENYKTLMKKTEDTNKWKGISVFMD